MFYTIIRTYKYTIKNEIIWNTIWNDKNNLQKNSTLPPVENQLTKRVLLRILHNSIPGSEIKEFTLLVSIWER